MSELRGVQHKVLDDDLVMLVDYMGEEAAIVQAARVSYGAGTKTVSDDVGLIRYLMQHRHTTPFEMCELKFLIRTPMDVWRQWIRHRTACLSGDTKLSFDAPNKVKHYQLSVKEIYDKFQPTRNTIPSKQRNPYFKADRVSEMRLRCVNETTLEVQHTSIVDIWESGFKDIYEVTLADGNKLKASEDHLCFTDQGWLKVKDLGRVKDLSTSKIITIKSAIGTGVMPSPNYVDESVEIWEPVLRWEDYYEVSNEGRVKRIVGGRGSKKGKPKKVTISDNNGQFRSVVSLNRPGVQETKLVHQLMAEAFLGEGLPGQEVCHEDASLLYGQPICGPALLIGRKGSDNADLPERYTVERFKQIIKEQR